MDKNEIIKKKVRFEEKKMSVSTVETQVLQVIIYRQGLPETPQSDGISRSAVEFHMPDRCICNLYAISQTLNPYTNAVYFSLG